MKTQPLSSEQLVKERESAAQAAIVAQQRLDRIGGDHRRLAADLRLASPSGKDKADIEQTMTRLEEARADAERDLQRATAAVEDLSRRADEQRKHEAVEKRAALEVASEQCAAMRLEAAATFDQAAENLQDAVRTLLEADSQKGAVDGQLQRFPDQTTRFLLTESLFWRLQEVGVHHEIPLPHVNHRRPLVDLLSGKIPGRDIAEPGPARYRTLTVHEPIPGGKRNTFEPDKSGRLRPANKGQM